MWKCNHWIDFFFFRCSNAKHKQQQNVQIFHELLLLMALCFPIHLAFSLSFVLMELLSVFFENGTFHFVANSSKYLWRTNQNGISFPVVHILFLFGNNKEFFSVSLCNLLNTLCGFFWSLCYLDGRAQPMHTHIRFIFMSIFDGNTTKTDRCSPIQKKEDSFSAWWHYKYKHFVPFLKVFVFNANAWRYCDLCSFVMQNHHCDSIRFAQSERLLYFRNVEFSIDSSRSNVCVCVPFGGRLSEIKSSSSAFCARLFIFESAIRLPCKVE